MKAMMSCFVMRPPSPEPVICERLMPCSRAILRTSGEERASSSSSAGAEVAAGVGAGAGAGAVFFSSLFSSCFFSGATGAGAVLGGAAAAAYDCVHADRGSFGDFDFAQDAGSGGGNFGIYFIGGDFEQRFIALHFVAGFLQPLGNCAFNDGLAHLGHDDVSRHDFLPQAHG
jgi:hypothetical protein